MITTPPAAAPTLRCAIYTRAPGDAAGRSLTRQRAACRAYIASQREAGWVALPDYYADRRADRGAGRVASAPGRDFPALQRLLLQVEHRRIDRLVIDQLSSICRSANDLAGLMMVLDYGQCALVVARHKIDGATPVGRQVLVAVGAMAPFIDRPGPMRSRMTADQNKAMAALQRLRTIQAFSAGTEDKSG